MNFDGYWILGLFLSLNRIEMDEIIINLTKTTTVITFDKYKIEIKWNWSQLQPFFLLFVFSDVWPQFELAPFQCSILNNFSLVLDLSCSLSCVVIGCQSAETFKLDWISTKWQLNFNGSHCAVAFNNSRKQLFIFSLFFSLSSLFLSPVY